MSAYEEEDEIPERLLADLAAAKVVPEEWIDRLDYSPTRLELSAAELDVLRCVSRGLTVQMTSEALGRGAETVKSQLVAARLRLGAKNTTHAVSEAIRRQLIS